MKTIALEHIQSLEIKKSKFITCLIPVSNEEDVLSNLNRVKEQYPDATHYCYAYILDNGIARSSDDGEPSKTAGLPILAVLQKQFMTNILVVVIRYFGGIKLGAGGLVRAYTKSTSNALKQASLIELSDGFQITFQVFYDRAQEIDNLLLNYHTTKEYLEVIYYQTEVDQDILNSLNDKEIPYTILKKVMISKKNQ